MLNKKLSLLQAESLPELIASRTDQQRKLALQGLVGATRAKYDSWIGTLVSLLAHLEASIDFGEDELVGEQTVVQECQTKLEQLFEEISQFIEQSSRCRELIQSGARLAILGRPNAGKSSLMNLLCQQDKSIVSDLSGTTRDVIEHPIELDGHTVTLSDTAGLRNLGKLDEGRTIISSDLQRHEAIEREGMRRALEAARRSNLLLYLIDGSQLTSRQSFNQLEQDLDEIIEVLGPNSLHLIINKIDMWPANDFKAGKELESRVRLMPKLTGKPVDITPISCRTSENFDLVLRKISLSLTKLLSPQQSAEQASGGQGAGPARAETSGNNGSAPSVATDGASADLDYVNERHLALLRSTARHLDRAKRLGVAEIDEVAQHVRESVDYLSRIVGHVTNEQVIDIIFRDFCIGK